MQTTGTVRRQAAERRRDTLERLATERDVWVSTAHPDHGPHQVPLWFMWDGRAVWMCTSATSATARNVREEPRVRLAYPTYRVFRSEAAMPVGPAGGLGDSAPAGEGG